MFGFWIFLAVGTLAFDDGTCVKNQTLLEIPGEAVFRVFADLNYGPYCNATSSKGFQELTTAFYIISTLSKNDYISGITLGIKIIDTCQDSALVFKQSVSLSSELECADQTYSLGILASSSYTSVLQPFKDFTDIPIMFYSPQYMTQTLITIAVSFISSRFKSIDLLLTDSKTTFEIFGNESAKAGVCIKSLVDLEDKDSDQESLVVIAGDEFYIRYWMQREEVKSIQKTWIFIPLDFSDIQDVIPYGSFVLSTETISAKLGNQSWEGTELEAIKISLPYLLSMGKPIISIFNLFANFQNHNCSYESCSSSFFDYQALKDVSDSRVLEILGIPRKSNKIRVSMMGKLDPEVENVEEIAFYEVDMNSLEIFIDENRPKLNYCNENEACNDCINLQHSGNKIKNISNLDPKDKIIEGIYLIRRAWVFILLVLIACGTIICLGVSAYILYRFFTEEFLDGNPILTYFLILEDIFVLYSVIPFCLNGHDHEEYLSSIKIFISTLSTASVFSTMLARSFFLAFSTKGVFSSHINGFLEGLMVFFVVGVQLAMSTMFFVVNSTASGDVLRSSGFIALLSYNILLLFMLLGMSSLVWKIPRNYCEGKCFFFTTIALLVDWLIWIGTFLLVRADWRDIIVAFGLVSTGYVIIGGLFITRVYYMVTHLERKNTVRTHFENADLRTEPRRRSFRQTTRRPFHDYVLPMEGVRNSSGRFPTANPNFYGSSSPQPHEQPDKILGFNNYGYHSDIHEENHYVVPNVRVNTLNSQKKRVKIESDYAQPTYPIHDEEDFDRRNDRDCIETEIYVEGNRLSPYKKGPNESYPSRCSSPRLHPTEATINEEEEEIEEMTKVTRF
ncbi:uncharacterized protein boss [Chelonus insularis]|uniref:uncharacterized protein boss n=1 Tax=Chelonus insularis TaxID=460826 RepID=UPI001589A2B3|nr:uncharacterized protein LOC118066139 [Chelonus insularis]